MPVATRPMTSRLRVRGWLRALSPLHVGGVGQDPNAALPVAVDGRGRLYVPGTSLAGAMRALLHPGTGHGDGPTGDEANQLWGFTESGTQNGTVSRILTRDALITSRTRLDTGGEPADLLDPARLEARYSVGIDRRGGVAAHGFLHARVIVPKGSYLRFELDVNATDRTLDADRRHLRRLLALLADGQLRLGAAKTRGLGHLALLVDQTDVREQDFTSASGLLAALEGADGGMLWPRKEWKDEPAPARQTLTVRIDWAPAAPVMVRSAADGFTVAAVPLASATRPDQVALVLPGTALKGVLRSHTERIERTVRGIDAPAAAPDDNDAERSAAFRRQLDQLPAVRALFGAAPLSIGRQKDKDGKDDDRGIGAVTVDDCFAKQKIPAQVWAGVYEPEDDTGTSPAITALREHHLERADHVAIDRWTGGAADGRLYSVLEPHGVTWEPIELTVDLHRLYSCGGRDCETERERGKAALALLLLALRDIKAGRVPIGYATNRGMGDISVRAITLAFPQPEEPVELDTFLAGQRAKELTTAWCTYIDGTPI
ncbi:RAMP superfamily CRISPR-associated protein [Streptomyces sp900105755]|uniref:RAMP superfamily CRISPR-associated protein n=1 Tax=Streptomyces sp. 900105755 TaxID=3154389 RepID=A0ABV1TWN3_9ACTN